MEERWWDSEAARAAAVTLICDRLRSLRGIVLSYGIGSFFAGGEFADIDIAILAEPGLAGQESLWSLCGQVAASLERAFSPRREFDVRPLNGAPVEARFVVVRDGKPLWTRSEDERAIFEADTLSEYQDYLPVLRAFDRRLLEAGVGC